MEQYGLLDSVEITIMNTMRKQILLRAVLLTSLLSCIVPSTVQAEWMFMKSDGDTLLLQGIEKIYNVEFDEAEKKFTEVIKLYPDHPAGQLSIRHRRSRQSRSR